MAKNSKMGLKEAMETTFYRVKEMRIMEGNDAESSGAVVCATVEAVPIPGTISSIENCSKCNNRIWVSLSSPKNPPRICYHCYVAAIQALDDNEKVEIGVHSEVAKKAPTKRVLS